jgi:hypothetical protein
MNNKGLSTGKLITIDLLNRTNGAKWVVDGSTVKLYTWDGSAWNDTGIYYEI